MKYSETYNKAVEEMHGKLRWTVEENYKKRGHKASPSLNYTLIFSSIHFWLIWSEQFQSDQLVKAQQAD